MRAWILLLVLVGALNFCGCSKPRVPPQEVAIQTPAPTTSLAPERTVYLLRRVAAATEDSLHGFAEGSEVKVIEKRSEKLLVETQGMQFEINRQDATNDLDQRDRVLARASEREAARLVAMAMPKTEDRKFLAEENARRRSFAETRIERLRSAIQSTRVEIARLETEHSLDAQHTTASHGGSRYAERPADSTENKVRQERIAVLQTHIANCDREIQILSDAAADGD